MTRINQILSFSLFSLLSLPLVLSSCSEENLADNDLIAYTDEISFVTDMPGVSSRTTYDISSQLFNTGFIVTAFCPEDKPLAGGILDFHCKDAVITRQADGKFRGDGCRWPGNDSTKLGSLKFFAFHPSIVYMKACAGVGNECFIYSNNTKKDATGVSYDLRLTKFRVAPDISNQVDFVTAIGEGNKTQHLYRTIDLKFEHQLCGVEIGAWGNSSLYDIEIAGVRIGGTVVEADFDLSATAVNPAGDENTIGKWYITSDSPRGYVDYVFDTGDKVVCINTSEHNTKEQAVSIMGSGGKAMLIPYRHDKWDHIADRSNSGKGMYFCSLVRITQHGGDHHCVYPSTDPQSQDYIVYLSVLKSDGTVMQRLDKNGKIYGTSVAYTVPDTEELRAYGWAAAPANVDWKPGYTYSYLLDYSRGVGVHDPADSNPASPIIDWGGVEITATTGQWNSGGVINEGSWGTNSNNTGPGGTVWWK